MIITPFVEVIKSYTSEYMYSSETISVVTCAAPICSNTIECENMDYQELLYRRIISFLVCIAYYGYEYVVLGAWGCGAFGNDAEIVARLFHKALFNEAINGIKLCRCFKRIDFAVLDKSEKKYNFKSFKNILLMTI